MSEYPIPEDLKPCPFCGGEPKLERKANMVIIYCQSCDAEIRRDEGKMQPNRTIEAIADWNRRQVCKRCYLCEKEILQLPGQEFKLQCEKGPPITVCEDCYEDAENEF